MLHSFTQNWGAGVPTSGSDCAPLSELLHSSEEAEEGHETGETGFEVYFLQVHHWGQ